MTKPSTVLHARVSSENAPSRQTPLRAVLTRVFQERKVKNPSYSFRAFSRDLCISHTTVARILEGKSTLSLAKTKKIASRLKMFDQDLSLLLYGTRVASEADSNIKELLSAKLDETKHESRTATPIQIEDLDGLSELNVIQVLEAFQFARDREDALTFDELQTITTLPTPTLRKILARLRALNLVSVDLKQSPKLYRRSIRRWEMRSKSHHSGFKKIHTQAMEVATKALTQHSPGERYSATEFIPVPEKAKAEFMEACHEFLEKLHKIADCESPPESVFLVSLHAFSWLKGKK